VNRVEAADGQSSKIEVDLAEAIPAQLTIKQASLRWWKIPAVS